MRRWRIACAMALIAGTAACSDTPLESECCRVVEAIDLAPDTPTLVVGASIQFTATVLDDAGDPIETDVTFQVSNTARGGVTGTGMFTAASPGTVYVRAVLGTVRDSTLVTITQ